MKRTYRQQRSSGFRKLGTFLFSLFVLFVAYRILTPPKKELARISSPDGKKEARLRRIYYVSQPSYKIDYREKGNRLWLNLLYLPSYTNVPPDAARAAIRWGPESERLYFSINGSNIWSYTVP